MEQLWAPWRMAYLKRRGMPDPGCFLCAFGQRIAAVGTGENEVDQVSPDVSGSDATDLVVWRGRHVYALLNAFPYASGHVLVTPYVHEGMLDRLDTATAAELMEGTRLLIRALRLVYQPEGFNVGANLGTAAGAGFGDHLHMHIVPRWGGDTNFMTTTGDARVLPEALEDSARRIQAALATVAP
jgi:ATP adenylyltransferase